MEEPNTTHLPLEHPLPGGLAPAHRPAKRAWVFWLLAVAVACVLVLIGLCGILYSAAVPLMKQGSTVAGEWQQRLDGDYPGWKSVGFNVNTISGSGGAKTTYAFGLVPPGRDFPIGVTYVSEDGGPATSHDQVFRIGGADSEGAQALLDLLESRYARQGKNILSVESETDAPGVVVVTWRKTTGVPFFTWSTGSYEELTYDPDAREWRVTYTGH